MRGYGGTGVGVCGLVEVGKAVGSSVGGVIGREGWPVMWNRKRLWNGDVLE